MPEALIPDMPMPLGTARKVRLLVLGTVVPAGQQRQIQEEAPVERDLDDLLVIHHVAEGGGFGLHADWRRFHRHRRGGFAQLHEASTRARSSTAQGNDFCTKVLKPVCSALSE